jgi:hypothetical protein
MSDRFDCGWLRARALGLAVIIAVLAGALGGCARSPAVAPAALLVPIDIQCTTCNDFIRCEAPATAGAASGAPEPYVMFRLQDKDFWAQAATVWNYLVQHFHPWTQDDRPLSIYRESGGRRTIEKGLAAHIDATAAVLTTPAGSIDQRSGIWSDAAGRELGTCRPVARRDGFKLVREFLGMAPAAGDKR